MYHMFCAHIHIWGLTKTPQNIALPELLCVFPIPIVNPCMRQGLQSVFPQECQFEWPAPKTS